MHEKSRTCGTSWRHVSQLHRRNECSRATMRTVYDHVAFFNLPRPHLPLLRWAGHKHGSVLSQ